MFDDIVKEEVLVIPKENMPVWCDELIDVWESDIDPDAMIIRDEIQEKLIAMFDDDTPDEVIDEEMDYLNEIEIGKQCTKQIEDLANFIMKELPEEINFNGGAVDVAINIMRKYKKLAGLFL